MARGSESKQGLVVTLVFFILTTIGAGVAAYMGFSKVNDAEARVTAEKQATAAANDERDFYVTGFSYLRKYVGISPPDDKDHRVNRLTPVGPLSAELDGKFKKFLDDDPKAQRKADKTLTPGVRELERRKPWANGAPVGGNLFTLLEERDNEIKKLQGDAKRAQDMEIEERNKRTAAERTLAEEKSKYEVKAKELENKFKVDRGTDDARIKKLEDALKASVDNQDPEIKKKIDRMLELEKLLVKADENIKKLKDALNEAEGSREKKIQEASLDFTPRGKIVSRHRNGKKVTVNLGRAEGLTPQTIFFVHGLDQADRPLRRPKGKIEIISVGEEVSEGIINIAYGYENKEARLPLLDRETREPRNTLLTVDETDPIIVGDVLINPLWNPNRKTHVVIAGVLEMRQFGVLKPEEVIRRLERQNVVVDAYVDPRDGSIKGPGPSELTKYIILGSDARKGEAGVANDEGIVKAINDNKLKLVDEAEKKGAQRIGMMRFVEETGFTIPRTVTVDE